MHIRAIAAGLLCLAIAAGPPQSASAGPPVTPDPAQEIGIRRGICALLGDRNCNLARRFVQGTELTVYVQLQDPDHVKAARRAADDAGLYGSRIYVAKGGAERIGLANNVADAVVATDGDARVPRAEVLRVLRPGGVALLGGRKLIKPLAQGADDWGHHYHGPDNNPQSQDRLAHWPYLTQFVAEPRYATAPQAAVASAGRIFMAFGHVAFHQREEPVLDTLIAMNGFNGTVLWQRKLKAGIMVDRSTMIATPTTLYLGDDESCKLLDAATGRLTGQITPPRKRTGGTFFKWMALQDGVLYALVGKAEDPDEVARWRRRNHGWPWQKISKGYNQPDYPWGFARTLLAIDVKTGKALWHHTEKQPIDSRGLCLGGERIFLCRFGQYIACLSAADGKPLWRKTPEKDAELFKKIGPYRPGHGYVGGWKSTPYLKCTDEALYFVGPQVHKLTALSAKDGKWLWTDNAKDLHVVIRDDGLYTIGPEGSKNLTRKLEAKTGKVLATYAVSRRACTRSTGGPDGIFFRAPGGSVRLDLTAGKPQWISPMRPSCHVGAVVANGCVYWLPWACDCNLQMFGVVCLAPAGDFRFDGKATEKDRLEKVPVDVEQIAKFRAAPGDWVTYRFDNARSARTPAKVPDKVELLWRLAPKTEFEPTAPVAAGGAVFFSGSDGIVRAVEAESGKPRWTAYTGGAVRFPPTIADGRALVGSADGWVYAFEVATGHLLWRFRAAPIERKIPVHGSLVSTWPVSSGVLVHKGTAYFAAGINNFDGTHVYALDAVTGRIKWQNNSSGHLDAFSRRGVAVQGGMLLHGDKLYLAGGNVVSPAMFDIASGKCLNKPPGGAGSHAPRGRELALDAGGRVVVSGQPLYSVPSAPVYDGSVRWNPVVVGAKNADLTFQHKDGKWALVAQDKSGQALWQHPLGGDPVRWGIAVDAAGRIVVTLKNGRVLCFGRKTGA